MMVVVREGGDDAGAQLVRLAMGEFEGSDLLEVVVQQPGVVDQAEQDQRLAPRNRAALAAQQRACRELRARRLIGAAADYLTYPQPCRSRTGRRNRAG
jgi:hypothetical protein